MNKLETKKRIFIYGIKGADSEKRIKNSLTERFTPLPKKKPRRYLTFKYPKADQKYTNSAE